MAIHATSTVGAVAADHPLATRVFARHGIDFCCGGGKPLAEVCEGRDVDVTALIDEIERELADSTESEVNWNERPVEDLVEHILTAYHAPLREELPRIEQMMRKVHAVHGSKDQERFDELLATVVEIKADIEGHLPKEEEILFPMILAGRGHVAVMPMQVMEEEHEALGELLRRTRRLTDDYVAPEGACNTWRALWAALEELERSTHEHIHLENNVLHERARRG